MNEQGLANQLKLACQKGFRATRFHVEILSDVFQNNDTQILHVIQIIKNVRLDKLGTLKTSSIISDKFLRRLLGLTHM